MTLQEVQKLVGSVSMGKFPIPIELKCSLQSWMGRNQIRLTATLKLPDRYVTSEELMDEEGPEGLLIYKIYNLIVSSMMHEINAQFTVGGVLMYDPSK
jgi:hypothetical protein